MTISVPLRGLLTGLIVAIVVSVLLFADREWVHWYRADPADTAKGLQALDRQLAGFRDERAAYAALVTDLEKRIAVLESQQGQGLDGLASRQLQDTRNIYLILGRLAGATSINSLVANRGVSQYSAAAGRACTAYLMGAVASSGTDCGFVQSDQR